jgi:hypothetical protein
MGSIWDVLAHGGWGLLAGVLYWFMYTGVIRPNTTPKRAVAKPANYHQDEIDALKARKDWTKDKPGDYSPLPPETPEQLVARLDRQALKDWTDAWAALTGEPWESDEERDARRAAASKESETIKAMELEQTRILAAMQRAAKNNRFGAAMNGAFGRGGIIRDGPGRPTFTADPAGQCIMVEAGDTWASIAAQFGNTPLELLQANPGVNPHDVYPGQVLNRPKYRTIPENPIPSTIRRSHY